MSRRDWLVYDSTGPLHGQVIRAPGPGDPEAGDNIVFMKPDGGRRSRVVSHLENGTVVLVPLAATKDDTP